MVTPWLKCSYRVAAMEHPSSYVMHCKLNITSSCSYCLMYGYECTEFAITAGVSLFM